MYLKLPNTIKENVIAFNVVLPDEFQLSQYIDYDTQFDKAFIQPIQSILSTINWSATPRAELNTLEEFFWGDNIMSLREKLIKNSTIKQTSLLAESPGLNLIS